MYVWIKHIDVEICLYIPLFLFDLLFTVTTEAAQRRGFGQKLLDEMLHCLRQDAVVKLITAVDNLYETRGKWTVGSPGPKRITWLKKEKHQLNQNLHVWGLKRLTFLGTSAGKGQWQQKNVTVANEGFFVWDSLLKR